ncbi:MAG TPA: molybdenum cofactor cytidylyltransferase [Acidobacteriaceae bacterium]|nr:molybdenum cofactor cytidylyltransferase [Acidobacteriaceae bacterium]
MDSADNAKEHRRVDAIVLAAGRSSRMGEAKQLLRVNGNTLLARTLMNVRNSAVNETVLVLGYAAEQIRREIQQELPDHLAVVVNERHAEGMSGSLRVGLAALPSKVDAALIVLADQPFVRPETIDRIISAYKQGNAKIVVPHFEGRRGNPVLLDRTVFPEAIGLEGDTGFRTIFSSHAAELLAVDVDDEGVLLDIDSREDYERLVKRRV